MQEKLKLKNQISRKKNTAAISSQQRGFQTKKGISAANPPDVWGASVPLLLYILYHRQKSYANFASLCLFCFLYFIFNNSPAKLDSLLDFERGFRPACEIRTGIFDPRTTFCRLGTSRSLLMACTGLPESLQCKSWMRR